ncbi:phospholipid phosphatase 2-like isoform X1 [Colias croceus]|uniref:phospholipid phosphatase 2-like isoform X1 n=1 Tax=Colias crocea TaxID=72248 RepID=UPI001E27A5E6|nr:phospholipid phosphatase 2-like isoform X1 [Colias croceus]
MGALDCVNKISPRDSGVFTVNMNSQTSLNVNQKDLESQLIKPTRCGSGHSIWWTLAIDIPLLLLVLLLVGLFEFGIIPHHKNGFYCNDPALSHKFTGDTVNFEVLMSTAILCPLVLVFITEYIFHTSTYSSQTKLQHVTRNTLLIYRSYAYGLFFNLGVIEVMKGLIGNPRPTFFDICEPDAAKTCNGSEYVTTYECTSTRFSKWYQSDSYHSFPSGHTSLSVYCGLFMAWYLQKRAFDWQHRTVFLVPVIQMTCLTYAAVTSLTRITDHRHHWWDVLTGAVIGAASLVYTVLVLCNNFKIMSNLENKVMTESQHTVQTLVFDERQRSSL